MGQPAQEKNFPNGKTWRISKTIFAEPKSKGSLTRLPN